MYYVDVATLRIAQNALAGRGLPTPGLGSLVATEERVFVYVSRLSCQLLDRW